MSGLQSFDWWVQVVLSCIAAALASSGHHIYAQTLLLWAVHLLLAKALRRPDAPAAEGEDVEDMF